MTNDALKALIIRVLAENLKKTNDRLRYTIEPQKHNGVKIRLEYIFADKTSDTGFNSVECAEPLDVYAISGAENIKRKINALFCLTY